MDEFIGEGEEDGVDETVDEGNCEGGPNINGGGAVVGALDIVP